MSQKQRERFEAWFCGEGITRKLDRDGDGYKFMAAHSAWQTWKAAVSSEHDRFSELCRRPAGWLSASQQTVVDEIRAAFIDGDMKN